MELIDYINYWPLANDIVRSLGSGRKTTEITLGRAVTICKQRTFAASTQQRYRTHQDTYTAFCNNMGYTAVPASSDTLFRYALMLANSLQHSSVKQYLNIVRILHLEWGLPNPLESNSESPSQSYSLYCHSLTWGTFLMPVSGLFV